MQHRQLTARIFLFCGFLHFSKSSCDTFWEFFYREKSSFPLNQLKRDNFATPSVCSPDNYFFVVFSFFPKSSCDTFREFFYREKSSFPLNQLKRDNFATPSACCPDNHFFVAFSTFQKVLTILFKFCLRKLFRNCAFCGLHSSRSRKNSL